LYPVHASLGSMLATILLATERTGLHSLVGILVMLISIPLSYFMVASKESLIPGLGLGALGIAIEQVGLQLVVANLFLYYLNKKKIISYKWKHQFILILCVPMAALMAKEIANMLSNVLIINVVVMVAVYMASIAIIMWKGPNITGVTHKQLKSAYSLVLDVKGKW